MRKPTLSLITGVIASLALAAGAYFWATGFMDSMFAYRSPLRDRPPTAGQPVGDMLTRRVVFVLVDALRADTAGQAELMPFLAELRGRGAAATMHSQPPSYSEPGYTTLLTGAWPDIHDGPPINLEYELIPTWTQDNLFSAAQRAGRRTAVSGYNWFEKLIPQSAVTRSFYTPGEDDKADQDVVAGALPWLRAGDVQLVLIHIDQVDYAGHHEGGPRDPRWNAAAGRADAMLRQIAGTLDLTRDTLLVVSDHGQIAAGGHGGQDAITLVEPFVLAGAGVKPGSYGDVQMVDVAPTLAVLLGAAIPATTQGRVLTEMLVLPAGGAERIAATLAAQQGRLLTAYSAAIGRPAPAVGAGGPVAALAAVRAGRLNGERLPRAALAAALLLFLAAAVWRGRSGDLPWLLGAALAYLVIFNLRYAVLDGRTYSLSSVASSGEVTGYVAVTALLALLVGWLILVAGRGIVRRPPAQAALLTLKWTLLTAVSAGLPALVSFVLNGLTVTWALPDSLSAFLGFLALLQVLVVAAFGIILAGAAALAARLRKG